MVWSFVFCRERDLVRFQKIKTIEEIWEMARYDTWAIVPKAVRRSKSSLMRVLTCSFGYIRILFNSTHINT